MKQVLIRARTLLWTPRVAIVTSVLAGGGSALVFLPLFGLPGYELGLALSIGVGLLGGPVGVWAITRVRAGGAPLDPRAFLRAVATATLILAAACTVPAGVATLFATAFTPCDPFAQLGLFALLVLPALALAPATGAAAAQAFRHPRTATGVYAALVATSLVSTLLPVYFGPQVFAMNHFLGYLPGPLYDEALEVTPALLWFRAETIAWAAVFLATGIALGKAWRIALALGTPFFVVALALEWAGPHLGTRMSVTRLEEALGARRTTPHFDLVYPREKPSTAVDRLVRDLEFRHQQIRRFLGTAPNAPIRVFVYRSPEEKRALVGAERTQYAKPWRLELHLNDAPLPHPTLKHELVHVMAAALGTGPFRVPARFGVLPQMAVVEGVAVAAEGPQGELTLHGWAAAMRRSRLAPEVRQIFDPKGFYTSAAARAYTVAGSFLLFLRDTQGAEGFEALYRGEPFESAFGRPLPHLADDWERFLDAFPLEPWEEELARARFRKGSIFSRTCAREVANLSFRAAEALDAHPEWALSGFERCARLQPDEPSFPLGQARAYQALGKTEQAFDLLASVRRKTSGGGEVAAEIALAQADLAAKLGRSDEARSLLEEIVALGLGAGLDRTARVKLAGLDSPEAQEAVSAYFQPGPDGERLDRLRHAAKADPKNAVVAYLLGRKLYAAGDAEEAATQLQRALSENLPRSLWAEANRLLLAALAQAGACDEVQRWARERLGPTAGSALAAWARDWEERCDFDGAFR